MPQEDGLDLAAVARVARNIDLVSIRVINVEASCSPAPAEPMEPRISFESTGVQVSDSLLNVVCAYTLTVTAGGKQAAVVQVAYLMIYKAMGEKKLSEGDIEHFAKANGVYHSWPFLRQFLFDLTGKMGFPPLTLPVFQVLPHTAAPVQPKKIAGKTSPKTRRATRKA